MNTLYHVFSKGADVLFRTADDYIAFNNRIAAVSCRTGASVLAFSVMSNHVHLVIEAREESVLKDFAYQLTRAYAFYYSARYGESAASKLTLSHRSVVEGKDLLPAMLYVMKNPVHHSVAPTPFEYRFSSAGYLFAKELAACVVPGELESMYDRYCTLTKRQQRTICRGTDLPGDWLISRDGMVMPFSYMDIRRIRGIWKNNLKPFLYDMNRGMAEDGFSAEREDSADLSWNRLGDIEVCRIIDGDARERGLRSFHFFSDEDRFRIVQSLSRQHVLSKQIARCLWISDDEVKHYARQWPSAVR